MNTQRKTVVVTGATSGLGAAAAVAFGKKGFQVLLVGRDEARGKPVIEKVKAAGGDAELLRADLFSLKDVKRLGQEISRRAPKLDVLVNNAGGVFRKRELTPDGLERTFALNVAAPFALTEALIEPLSAAKGRVVNVATFVPSGTKATPEQLWGEKADAGMSAYSRAKLAVQALTREQQKRLSGRGITAVCFHPGIILETNFGSEMPGIFRAFGPVVAWVSGFRTTLDEAAGRFVRLATEEIEGGGYYKLDDLAEPPVQARDAAFGEQVWARLHQLTA
jgi:NAD(P)-dependent dehydrogenase (short-subunit alcohol dehydrogenase family)